MRLLDLRYTIRTLWKTPVFTGAAVLTIALGIAANTAIFSVVNAALVRSLPFPEPDRLMEVAERNEKLGLPFFASSTLNYLSWKEQTRAFEQLGAFGFEAYSLTGNGEPEQVSGGPISPSLTALLGLRPVAGRVFREDEDKAGSPPVALIGEALWKRRFAGAPSVIGQPLTVDGKPYTLVGVMGPELTQLTDGELWVPMVIDPTRENRLRHMIMTVGRLRAGVSMVTAQAEMDLIGRRVVEQYPDVLGWTIRLRSFSDLFVSEQLRTALKVLMGAVGLVLLIVCANVANLLLTRAVARQKEFAIRAAMGASRARVARQLVAEGLVLAGLGGAVGLVLAIGAVHLFNALPEVRQPVRGVRIDGMVLLFTLAASLVAGLLFSLGPAWHGTRADLNVVLKQGVRSSRGQQRPFVRNGQAALQLALATVLVVGAGLLAQSLLRLQRVPLGFRPSGVLTFRLSLPATRYPTQTQSWALYRDALAAIASLPGVRGAAVSSCLPFGAGSQTRTPVSTPDRSVLPVGTAIPMDWRSVSPGFFRTLGIPLLRGREFTEHDSPSAPAVVVVSRALARKFWGEDDPIGKTLHLVNARGATRADFTVVGVVGDVRNTSLNEELPTMYHTSTAKLWPSMEVAVRTEGRPELLLPSVRATLRRLDPDLPLSAVQTLDEAISASASQPRFNAVVLFVFAAVALLIAAIGVYGVLAYSVSQRTHEIGLRMALGADRRQVVRLVVREGMVVGAAGVVVGLLAAVGGAGLLASLLFDVQARDPMTFAVAGISLGVVALLACAAPAWRAARVDPVVALRAE